MRIAFLTIGNSRRSGYLNGDTLRNGGSGGSGTDTTNILVAEYLASQGHEVVLASEKLEPALEEAYAREGKHFNSGQIVRGVQYCTLDFDGVENREFDILHTCLWFHDYDKLPIKVTKALIYHQHMQWTYGIGEILEFVKANNLKLGFVDISEWQRSKTQDVVEFAKREWNQVYQTLIPNPVMDDVLKEVIDMNIQKKKNKFIFHAGWARGGDVAIAAVRELDLPEKEFHAFDYLMCTHPHQDSFFVKHNGQDKKTVFSHLAESEYFLYPLYTPYKNVHLDTFSCVVAEAIALGAIVISYPVAALPENFNGFVYWLPLPEGVTQEEMDTTLLYEDPEGKFNTAEGIKEAILNLEANPETKKTLAQGGREYILNKFNVGTVGKMWDAFLNEMLDEA